MEGCLWRALVVEPRDQEGTGECKPVPALPAAHTWGAPSQFPACGQHPLPLIAPDPSAVAPPSSVCRSRHRLSHRQGPAGHSRPDRVPHSGPRSPAIGRGPHTHACARANSQGTVLYPGCPAGHCRDPGQPSAPAPSLEGGDSAALNLPPPAPEAQKHNGHQEYGDTGTPLCPPSPTGLFLRHPSACDRSAPETLP